MKWLITAAALLLATQPTDTPEENEALPLEATATIEFTTDEVARPDSARAHKASRAVLVGRQPKPTTIDGGEP